MNLTFELFAVLNWNIYDLILFTRTTYTYSFGGRCRHRRCCRNHNIHVKNLRKYNIYIYTNSKHPDKFSLIRHLDKNIQTSA